MPAVAADAGGVSCSVTTATIPPVPVCFIIRDVLGSQLLYVCECDATGTSLPAAAVRFRRGQSLGKPGKVWGNLRVVRGKVRVTDSLNKLLNYLDILPVCFASFFLASRDIIA